MTLYKILTLKKSGSAQLLISKNLLLQYELRREYDSYAYPYLDPDYYYRSRIGNRETVGYGINGKPHYADRVDFPFPSLRYLPPCPEIYALREKEKGDWHMLSIEEKKELYRSNFCQTFTEMNYPTGHWMWVVGMSFLMVSAGIWWAILMQLYCYNRGQLPKSFELESVRDQLVRRIKMHDQPISGISSLWDYEKKQWKGGKKPRGVLFENPFDSNECIEPY